MNLKDELNKIIDEAREELKRIDDAENLEKGFAFVGKFFKYKNSYSCPKTEADYWWLYLAVIAVEKGSLITRQFEVDCNGKAEVWVETSIGIGFSEGYQEITKDEYLAAWLDVRNRLNTVADV